MYLKSEIHQHILVIGFVSDGKSKLFFTLVFYIFQIIASEHTLFLKGKKSIRNKRNKL